MTDVIVADHLSKTFRIPTDRSSTLKYRVTHPRSTRHYRAFRALDDVSFTVPEGQFLGIIGRNGSGKSTLLKLLSRIYVPTSGTLDIRGRVSPFLELGVGFNPELTARENVYLNGAVLGITRKELDATVDEIIEFAEVSEFAETKLKNFSSGMQVRLAFAVAIRANAGILLMDEVLAVGDVNFQQRCFDIFADYKREGRTVVLVTHDLASVSNYCDRALLLEHGRIIADDTPRVVTSQYRRMMGEEIATHRPSDDSAGGDEGFIRWGTGEVRIRSVSFVSGDGAPSTTVSSRRPLAIDIDIEVREPVSKITCGIAIWRSDGVHVTGTNTRIGGIDVVCPPPGETLRVRYETPDLQVQAGSYVMNVSCQDEHVGHMYDQVEAVSFTVVQEGDAHGIVDLGGEWTVASVKNAAPLR